MWPTYWCRRMYRWCLHGHTKNNPEIRNAILMIALFTFFSCLSSHSANCSSFLFTFLFRHSDSAVICVSQSSCFSQPQHAVFSVPGCCDLHMSSAGQRGLLVSPESQFHQEDFPVEIQNFNRQPRRLLVFFLCPPLASHTVKMSLHEGVYVVTCSRIDLTEHT